MGASDRVLTVRGEVCRMETRDVVAAMDVDSVITHI